MTDDDKTRIAKPIPGIEDRPTPAVVVLEDKVTYSKEAHRAMIEAHGKIDSERSKLGNENSQLRTEVATVNRNYSNLVTKSTEENKQLKKRSIYTSLISAVAGAGITALVLGSTNCDCNGSIGSQSLNYSNKHDDDKSIDAGISDAGASYRSGNGAGKNDAGALECKDIKGCYDQKHVDDLNATLNQCENDLRKCNDNLEACLEDKIELSKRPKSCTKYEPKACAPVKECSEIPYIIQGE